MKASVAFLVIPFALGFGCKARVSNTAEVKGTGGSGCPDFAKEKADTVSKAEDEYRKSEFLAKKAIETGEMALTAKVLARENGRGTPASQIESNCGCNDIKLVEKNAQSVTEAEIVKGMAVEIENLKTLDKTGKAAYEAAAKATATAFEIVAKAPLENAKLAQTVATEIHMQNQRALKGLAVEGAAVSPGELAVAGTIELLDRSIDLSPHEFNKVASALDQGRSGKLVGVDLRAGLNPPRSKDEFKTFFGEAEVQRLANEPNRLAKIAEKMKDPKQFGFDAKFVERSLKISEARAAERRAAGRL